MSIEQLLQDYNIPVDNSGKNWQPGWINIRCQMHGCTDTSNHGGFNIAKGYYNCWKCGHHSLNDVISTLLGIKWFEAKELLKQYESAYNVQQSTKKVPLARECELPINCHDIQQRHKKYLVNRGFWFTDLQVNWGIKGTGPIGPYKFRIIIPIYFNSKLVSYQGRDITGRSNLRYKACPIEKEVIHHKHIVYGIDHIHNRKAVIVEGVFDVWRLGYSAVSTFGTEVTNEQVILLANRLDKAYIAFDDEDAEGKAESLGNRLIALGVDVELISIDAEDPAELTDLQASNLMKLIR
jgi:DNA primase